MCVGLRQSVRKRERERERERSERLKEIKMDTKMARDNVGRHVYWWEIVYVCVCSCHYLRFLHECLCVCEYLS